MKRINAIKAEYVEAEVLGHPAIFTDLRIDRESVPDGLYMYELRHSGYDDSIPAQIGQSILVNFFGTVILSDPLVLDTDGLLSSEDDFCTNYDVEKTIADFLRENTMEPMEVYPARQDEVNMFFRDSDKLPYTLIGYVRGDFGSGNEFWSTWWSKVPELKTSDFTEEVTVIVEHLRNKGYLSNLAQMSAMCRSDSRFETSMPFHGFKLRTEKYRYYLRCVPRKGDYNFYVMCYLNEEKKEVRHE